MSDRLVTESKYTLLKLLQLMNSRTLRVRSSYFEVYIIIQVSSYKHIIHSMVGKKTPKYFMQYYSALKRICCYGNNQ